MKKQSEALIGIKVITCCTERTRTVSDITKKIYGNVKENNIGRVFRIVEYLVTEKILIPKVNNGSLAFMVDKDVFKGLLS